MLDRRFDGKADEMGEGRQGLRKQLVVPGQGGGGIAVERRADGGGDIGDGHIFGMQAAVAVEKMVHDAPFFCNGL